ncbi:penicillin acylase family protein [Leifsonia sp. NPDC056665]|uniref:penicillin acylase family protein n=1 Tax=Leifsonia sp. NPDC056665 TaxID=3345901 RepID=UPI0036CA3557
MSPAQLLTVGVIPELEGDVDIRVDTWGVSHIKAGSAADAFRAQGWVQARDRLFQMDLWLRRGLGRLAEAFGEQFSERDRASRLFLYRGDRNEERQALGDATIEALEAFADGVNAFIDAAHVDPVLLPPEFSRYRYLPLYWNGSDISRIRTHGLFDNVIQEVERVITLRDFGPGVEDLRKVREPLRPVSIPAGLDVDLFSVEILSTYLLATSPVVVDGEPGKRSSVEGSNNWAISGTRTASGRPIVANDPHRALPLPSLRYLIHLTCPEFDVIGAQEPVLPGVSLGHNEHIAFGLTIFPSDQEDLYVYELNPDDPSLYLYKGRWEPFTRIVETVKVRDSEDVEIELGYSIHGPVIHVDLSNNVAYALRAAWLEPGAAPYIGSLKYLNARSTTEFIDAVRTWAMPSVNHVVADIHGHIAWAPRGLFPKRPNWDGTVPVPGDGHYEWDGYWSADDLPTKLDPEAGWIATANERNLPDEWNEPEITSEWFAPYRYQRIAEVLSAERESTVESSARLQTDIHSIPAREVVGALRRHQPTVSPAGEPILQRLLEWDFEMSADSIPAAEFELWYREHLRPALLQWALQTQVDSARLGRAVEHLLPSRQEELTGDPRIDIDLLRSLDDYPDDAVTVLTDSLNGYARRASKEPDRELGELQVADFKHPIRRTTEWDIAPLPKSGSPDTVNVTARDANYRQTVGASVRLVMDVGEWDGSLAANAPGQSGDPRSPHYADLAELWAAGTYFPLVFSEDAVAGNTDELQRLISSRTDARIGGPIDDIE